MKRYISHIAVCMLVALFFVTAAGCGGGSKRGDAQTAAKANIFETGELAAVNSHAFVLPRFGRWSSMKIIGLLDHGTEVEPGDSVIQLDPAEVEKYIIDKESDLETQNATLQKMLIEQQNTFSSLESSHKSALASFELKKIELESARFESERNRRVKELQFQQAEITMEKDKKKMELAKIINENNVMIQKVRVQQTEEDIRKAKDIIPQLTVFSPIGGVFQIARRNNRSSVMVKVGDNVYSGNPMGNVPELRWMKVLTQINENDYLKIRQGQKVSVRLDAMPELSFEGEISYVGKLCKKKGSSSKEKIFDVEVKILKSDERLKPGMTVSCEFLAD